MSEEKKFTPMAYGMSVRINRDLWYEYLGNLHLTRRQRFLSWYREKRRNMAKDRDPQPDPQASSTSTNVILAQILSVAQDSNTTLKASLKVASDSQALLQQLVDAIGGEGSVYTVKVTQLAKELAAQLKK